MGSDGGRKRARDESDDEITPNDLLPRRDTALGRIATQVGSAIQKMDSKVSIEYVPTGNTVEVWCTPENGTCALQVAPLLRILSRFIVDHRKALGARSVLMQVGAIEPSVDEDKSRFGVIFELADGVPFEAATESPSAEDLAIVLCSDTRLAPVHSRSGEKVYLTFDPRLPAFSMTSLLPYRAYIEERKPMLYPKNLAFVMDAQ